MSDKIRFGIPIDIIKSKNAKGDDVYKFKGLASTNDKDNQGETLLAKQFDLNDFKNVNYNHQGAKDANAVLGEITSHNFDRAGLNVEGELWGDMPMTPAVVSLMKRKAKQGKKLQLSVEGQVLQRGANKCSKCGNSLEKSSVCTKCKANTQGFNKIVKAKLTGVAVTLNPINGNTFCDLIEKGITNNEWLYSDEDELLMKAVDTKMKKGKSITNESDDDGDDDMQMSEKDDLEKSNCPKCKTLLQKGLCSKCGYTIEKAMSAGSDTGTDITNKQSNGSALKKEDVESKKNLSNTLSKSEAYSTIFDYFYPTIDFKKAGEIYKLTEKISKMEKKPISKETLSKAFEIIELAIKENENSEVNEAIDLIKSDFNDLEKSEQVEELIKAGYDEEVANNAADKHEDDEKDKKKKKKHVAKKKDDDNEEEEDENFEKALGAIEEISINQDMKFGALGVIIKSQSETIEKISTQLEETTDALNEAKEVIQKSFDLIEKISKTAVKFNRPIGGANGVERFKENKENGNKVYNINNRIQKAELIQTLDNLSNLGGKFNEDLLKAASDLEIAGVFGDRRMIPYLKDVHNIEVVTSDGE